MRFFESIAARNPKAMSDLPAKRRLVEEVGNGILVDPYDHQGTAEAVAELLADQERLTSMSRRGRDAFVQSMNWESVTDRLLVAYKELV